MSYEDQIRFKHAVEDALMQLVSYASLLSDRELELAIAKLGDAAQDESISSARDHLALKGLILDYVRKLRTNSQSKQNKAKRLWTSGKKGQIRREIAIHRRTPAVLAYEKEERELEEKYEQEHSLYVKAKRERDAEIAKLSLFQRWFGSVPPLRNPPIQAYPRRRPADIYSYEVRLRALDFGDLIIERILIHSIPSVELAREFATEDNIRSYDVRLLEKAK